MNKRQIKGYLIGEKLGGGAFGEIYSGNQISNDEEVAIKVEKRNTQSPQLEFEFKLYQFLGRETTSWENGIPSIYTYYSNGDCNFMVLELLGKSLEDLFNERQKRFSLKTICMLGIEMISRLEYIHSRGIIHRDMKPDNFTIGNKDKSKIFIIDFGLSKSYLSSEGNHIQLKKGKSMIGTARYASIKNHMGHELSRRDDLESLAYILIYFAKGGILPWMSLPAQNMREKYKKILEKKKMITSADLCFGLPDAFTRFLDYTKELEFNEAPNYFLCRKMFKDVLVKNFESIDYKYDWTEDKSAMKSSYLSRNQFKELKVEKDDYIQDFKDKEIKRLNLKFNREMPSNYGMRPSQILEKEKSRLGFWSGNSGNRNSLFRSMAGQIIKPEKKVSLM